MCLTCVPGWLFPTSTHLLDLQQACHNRSRFHACQIDFMHVLFCKTNFHCSYCILCCILLEKLLDLPAASAETRTL